MFKIKENARLVIFALFSLLAFMTSVTIFAATTINDNTSSDSYVELYSPFDEVDISMNNRTYFNATVQDSEITESGKGLILDYKAGYSNPVAVTIPTGATKCDDFEGLALWVDIPLTSDEYSFTLYLENESNVWETMELGSELTLISDDGEITNKYSLWKRQQLNGFRGWLLLPKEAYKNCMPNDDEVYNFIFMIEHELTEGFFRTEDIKITIGSIGYYTNYVKVLYDFAGANSMEEKTLIDLDSYINEINRLNPKNDRQINLKNKMLVYYSNLKANFVNLTVSEQIEITSILYDQYYAYMEEYLYGEIKKTNYVMSFAIMSDTHFTEKWVNERFLGALEDAKTEKPDLSAAFVLGDISDNGVSVVEKEGINTELDNYYDWLDSFEYKNEKGDDIPIINILGNHDVRGHHKENYPKESYQPAIDMYLEREQLTKEANSIQFDTWINGYHFIFLNTDIYHSDDCYLSAETIKWLDETLSENEDGRPMFVMVHQPLGKVHTLEGSEMTFEEVIAKHPSAIVSSGHEHAAFGNAKITQEGNGVYINQPAMVNVDAQYYIVEVYEGGVIYRARESATDTWIISSDVVVMNEDMSNNLVFDSSLFDESSLITDNVSASIISYDSVTGNILQLIGNNSSEVVSIPIGANGNVSNYAGYALYIESTSPLTLTFNDKGLISNEKYYSFSTGEIIEKTITENGQIIADGWIVIPRDAISGEAYPSKSGVLCIEVGAETTVYLNQVSYYFNLEEFTDEISNLSYCFYNEDEIVTYVEGEYGASISVPTNIEKEETDQYSYVFKGWDTNGDGNIDELPESLKGNLVAKAVYEAVVRQYTYKLYDADGETVLLSKTVDYGTKVEIPNVNKLFGWDIDGDGAVESLPEIVLNDFSAIAVLGEPPYNNAEILYDPSAYSTISISTGSWYGVGSKILVSTLASTNMDAPEGKVVQFTHPGHQVAAEGGGGVWIVTLQIPSTEAFDNFQGYAIWIDIDETTEEYTGGLCINSTIPYGTNSWTLINVNGEVVEGSSTEKGSGLLLNLGKGFTGWLIVDKSILSSDQSPTLINPSSSGTLQFRFVAEKRTTPFTMNIGQILVFENKEAIVDELSSNIKDFYEYCFSDGNGFIYKAGQISANESIIIPDNPVHSDEDVFFAGWDINRDGNPDELPPNGILTSDLDAIAVFCHIDAFDTFNKGENNWKTDTNPKDLTITLEEEVYLESPTGKATHISVNESANESTGWVYAMLNLPTNDTAKGVAFWMDASTVDSFTFCLWKNWIPKSTASGGGDYVYLLNCDGTVTTISGWRQMGVPANFKGWVIIPLTVFIDNNVIYPGDYLRLGFQFGDYNPLGFSADIYIGEAVTFKCPVQLFMTQINKQVYGFKDYDGSFISSGILVEGEDLPIPSNPVREGWVFVGWDINGDGIVENEMPSTIDGRNFMAEAVYTRQFTYKFIDQDNNVIFEKTAEYNSLVLPPFRYMSNDPYYKYDVEYIDYFDGILLTQDLTFHVNITKTNKTFTVVFVDENGNVLQENIMSYGQMPVFHGEMPIKPSNVQYTYFTSWDKEISIVTEDVIYRVTYEEIINEYKVMFFDEDKKTVLDEQMVAYGQLPVYAGKTPTKSSDSKYKYVFAGWDKDIAAVTGDVIYVAEYSAEPIDGHYHDYSSALKCDDKYHWRECECGEHIDKAEHEFFANVLKEATETEQGLIEYKCSTCSYSYTKTLPAKAVKQQSNNGCSGSLSSVLLSSIVLFTGVFVSKKKKKSFQ